MILIINNNDTGKGINTIKDNNESVIHLIYNNNYNNNIILLWDI